MLRERHQCTMTDTMTDNDGFLRLASVVLPGLFFLLAVFLKRRQPCVAACDS